MYNHVQDIFCRFGNWLFGDPKEWITTYDEYEMTL